MRNLIDVIRRRLGFAPAYMLKNGAITVDRPISAADAALIEAEWKRHHKGPPVVAVDPLAGPSKLSRETRMRLLSAGLGSTARDRGAGPEPGKINWAAMVGRKPR